MTADQKYLMRKTLDNLKVDDFKRFKHCLHDQGQIPWGKLESADTDDTLDLMVQTYDMAACGIMVAILEKMNQKQLATELERELGKGK